MLSVENTPSDPSSCLRLIKDSSSSSSSNRSRSDDDKCAHRPEEVDLPVPPNISSSHDHQYHNQLPKFTIRDYVFNTRSKNIKTNWPFSLKNLNLCLKHGVKELLPPFQSLDKVRDHCFTRCAAETQSIAPDQEKDWSCVNVGEPSGSANSHLNNRTEAFSTGIIASSRSEGENDFPSTITSVSPSEIDSIPANKPSALPLEVDTSLEAEAAASAPNHKTTNSVQPPAKKCRLIVKFGSQAERNSSEDIASNCTGVLESMASKVCPVCRTFSSSSNTTLNAHIDQCLSVESTPKWTADFKLNRHRIKPRKTRLMVDIYSTAKQCTLEELNRRNGTSWAMVSGVTSQNNEDKPEMHVEAKRQRISPLHPEQAGDIGAVYIDANGTKIRILSKFNDTPAVSTVGEDLGPSKCFGGGKGNKLFSAKRKRCHKFKHHKYLNLAPQNKKKIVHRSLVSEICRDQLGSDGKKGNVEKVHIGKQDRSGDSGTLRQWVCSKRSDTAKKVNGRIRNKSSQGRWHTSRDLVVDNAQFAGRSQIAKFGSLHEDLTFSPENGEETPVQMCDPTVNDRREHHPLRKSVRSPLYQAICSDSMETSLSTRKETPSQLSEDDTLIHDSHRLKCPSTSQYGVPVSCNHIVGMHEYSGDDFDIASASRAKTPRTSDGFASRCKRSSTAKKKHLPASGQASKNKYKNMGWHSQDGLQNIQKSSHSQSGSEGRIGKVSSGMDSVENKRVRELMNVSKRQAGMTLEGSQLTSNFYAHDEGGNGRSSFRDNDNYPNNGHKLEFSRQDLSEQEEEIDIQQGSPCVVPQNDLKTLTNSVDLEFHQLNENMKMQSNSSPSIEKFERSSQVEVLTCPTKPRIFEGQEIYNVDGVDNGIIVRSTHMGDDLESDIGQGNSFSEVDPIPIPGPPGSFLPSPGGSVSEEFEDNASPNTSHIQSSEDQYDFVDGDSSDSPISATTTISNSVPSGSDLRYFELLSVGPNVIQNETRRGMSSGVGLEPSQDTDASTLQISTGTKGIKFLENLKGVKMISMEKGPINFRFDDDQPCCCQRRDRLFQDDACKESHLPKGQAIATLTIPPPMGREVHFSPNLNSKSKETGPDEIIMESCPSCASMKVAIPVNSSLGGSVSSKGFPDSEMKHSGHANDDSVNPSASNPVLRLMGKNLMVVNKDEDLSMPLGQVQPNQQVFRRASQFPSSSGISSGSIQIQEYNTFHLVVPQGVRLSQDSNRACSTMRMSNSPKSNSNPQLHETHSRLPTGFLPKHHRDVGFIMSCNKTNYDHPTQPNHSRSRLTGAPVCERVATVPGCENKNVHSLTNSAKETTAVDEYPEHEARLTIDDKCLVGSRENQIFFPRTVIPTTIGYDSRQVNGYLLSESQMVHETSFVGTSRRISNVNPIRWGCTTEGAGVPFASGSSSTNHLRSALPHPPSLS